MAATGRRDIDVEVMKEHGIPEIDLVVVNFILSKKPAKGASYAESVEQLHWRARYGSRFGQNHAWVSIVTSPADYDNVIQQIQAGGINYATRQRLAAKAYAHTAQYDGAIAHGWRKKQQKTPFQPQ